MACFQTLKTFDIPISSRFGIRFTLIRCASILSVFGGFSLRHEITFFFNPFCSNLVSVLVKTLHSA